MPRRCLLRPSSRQSATFAGAALGLLGPMSYAGALTHVRLVRLERLLCCSMDEKGSCSSVRGRGPGHTQHAARRTPGSDYDRLNHWASWLQILMHLAPVKERFGRRHGRHPHRSAMCKWRLRDCRESQQLPSSAGRPHMTRRECVLAPSIYIAGRMCSSHASGSGPGLGILAPTPTRALKSSVASSATAPVEPPPAGSARAQLSLTLR